MGTIGYLKVDTIHHPETLSELGRTIVNQAFQNLLLMLQEVFGCRFGKALHDRLCGKWTLSPWRLVESFLNLQRVEAHLAQDVRRPKQRPLDRGYPVQVKEGPIDQAIAEEKDGDAPPLPLVRERFKDIQHSHLQQKLSKPVEETPSRRQNADALATLQGLDHSLPVLNKDFPFSFVLSNDSHPPFNPPL
jgi:hypothetical protein